jgi:flagellin
MGFRINTNIAALNAHTNASMNNRALDSSLEKLSSGLRINKAADDASGMAIADSLRSQASSLGQVLQMQMTVLV